MIKTDIAKELRRYTGKGNYTGERACRFPRGEEHQQSERKVPERA